MKCFLTFAVFIFTIHQSHANPSSDEFGKRFPVGTTVKLVNRLDAKACKSDKTANFVFVNGQAGDCTSRVRGAYQRSCTLRAKKNVGEIYVGPAITRISDIQAGGSIIDVHFENGWVITCARQLWDLRFWKQIKSGSILYNLGVAFEFVPVKR